MKTTKQTKKAKTKKTEVVTFVLEPEVTCVMMPRKVSNALDEWSEMADMNRTDAIAHFVNEGLRRSGLLGLALASMLSASCATDPDPGVVVACVTAGVVCAFPVAVLGGSALALPGDEVPIFGMRQDHGSPFTGSELASALTIFVEEWQARIGDTGEVREAFARMNIAWVEGEHIVSGGRRVAGHWDGNGRDALVIRGGITLAWVDGLPLWRTALAHELCHSALMSTKRDPGADHKTPWTHDIEVLIEAVNARMSAERIGAR